MNDREYLLVRGRLNRADDFAPLRCGSTRFIRQRDDAGHSDLFVETLGPDGSVLRIAPAAVRSNAVCSTQVETWQVRGYVPLDQEAVEVRLRRGDRTLWSARIPAAPSLRLSVDAPPRRGRITAATRGSTRGDRGDGQTPGYPGGRPAVLSVVASEPADSGGAFLTIVHQWGERRFRTVYVGPADSRIEIPADRLPGGPSCRFAAIYSNGIRSAVTTTEPYALDAIGPILRIRLPRGDEALVEGMSLPLEGFAEDPEDPAAMRELDRLGWSLDGTRVGEGPVATITGLPAGSHEVTLRYRPRRQGARGNEYVSAGAEVTRSVRIKVGKTTAVGANDWPEWDPFEGL